MTQPPTGPEHPEQQPEQPQDPYGAPPPPPPAPGYGDGYGTSSAPPPQYGTPAYPPPPGNPPGTPAYPPPTGNPYAAPSGYPTHAFTGEQAPASKGMAIGALVSSFLCCLPIATVLGIIVLRRSKDGRDHGKGLAIAAIIINVLAMIASIAIVVVAVVFGSQVRAISDLEPGDCISADGILSDDEQVGVITQQDCTEAHDAEVMGTATLTSADLESDNDDFTGLCAVAVVKDPERAAVFDSGDVSLLAVYEGREVGDTVACLALDAGGDRLTEPLVD